jgi:hypothetical protein
MALDSQPKTRHIFPAFNSPAKVKTNARKFAHRKQIPSRRTNKPADGPGITKIV